MPVHQLFFPHYNADFSQAAWYFTDTGKNKKIKRKTLSIIIGYTSALLILRDRKLASEKYTIVVVTQNKVGGGHNLIDSSTPFCKFQAFPLIIRKKNSN